MPTSGPHAAREQERARRPVVEAGHVDEAGQGHRAVEARPSRDEVGPPERRRGDDLADARAFQDGRHACERTTAVVHSSNEPPGVIVRPTNGGSQGRPLDSAAIGCARQRGRAREEGLGMGKRIARTMVLTAALALASLGFAGTAGAEDYRVGFAQPIDTLNPFQAYSSPTYFIYNGVYDLLVNFDTATGEPDPEHSLAESWDTSTDGKVWTYHLRDGVKWADGQPFTSEDVRWTFQTVIDTQNVLQGYLAGVTKVEARRSPDACA